MRLHAVNEKLPSDSRTLGAMNAPRILLLLLLIAGIARAQAQDNATPAAAPEPAETEMQKWITTTDAQWQAAFKRDITAAHDTELNKLKLQYLTSLEAAIARASGANDLDGALALRNEQKRFGDTNVFPERDDAGDAAPVKQLRAAIRAKYDAVLAKVQAQLTQRQRLDDALLVKTRRDEVAAAWITPAVAAAAVKGNPPALPPKPAPAPASATVKAWDITKTLPGTWHFHWTETGFDADYRFRADGTFTEVHSGHKGAWKIADDKVLMEMPGASPKTMLPPIVPEGTKVIDQRKNRHVEAVKKNQ